MVTYCDDPGAPVRPDLSDFSAGEARGEHRLALGGGALSAVDNRCCVYSGQGKQELQSSEI